MPLARVASRARECFRERRVRLHPAPPHGRRAAPVRDRRAGRRASPCRCTCAPLTRCPSPIGWTAPCSTPGRPSTRARLRARALDPAARTAFAEALARWCADTGIVTEFEHLHPWKARTELLDPAGLEPDREIVYVDLTQDAERMWRESFTHACRKNIKRARREGVRVRDATSEADARELHRIYAQTMDRQGALERYHLPPEYFVSFLERLPDNSRILLAEHEGRVDRGDALPARRRRRVLVPWRCGPRLPARPPHERDRRRDDPLGAGAGQAAARARRRLRAGRRHLPLQVELLAAAGRVPRLQACPPAGRVRGAWRRVARPLRHGGRGGVLPPVPGRSGSSRPAEAEPARRSR